MNLFKKRKTTAGTPPNSLMVQLNRAVEYRQQKAAAYLSSKTQYWNRSSKIIALAAFCFLFGCCCLFLFIKAIIHF